MLSSYFYVSQVPRQTYIETMQPKPFEEWIEKGHQRDANLCGAYASCMVQIDMVQVAVGTQTNRFSAAARQS